MCFSYSNELNQRYSLVVFDVFTCRSLSSLSCFFFVSERERRNTQQLSHIKSMFVRKMMCGFTKNRQQMQFQIYVDKFFCFGKFLYASRNWTDKIKFFFILKRKMRSLEMFDRVHWFVVRSVWYLKWFDFVVTWIHNKNWQEIDNCVFTLL